MRLERHQVQLLLRSHLRFQSLCFLCGDFPIFSRIFVYVRIFCLLSWRNADSSHKLLNRRHSPPFALSRHGRTYRAWSCGRRLYYMAGLETYYSAVVHNKQIRPARDETGGCSRSAKHGVRRGVRNGKSALSIMQCRPFRRSIHGLILIGHLQVFGVLACMAYIETLGRLVYIIVAKPSFIERIGFRIGRSGRHTDADSLLFPEILRHQDPSKKEN